MIIEIISDLKSTLLLMFSSFYASNSNKYLQIYFELLSLCQIEYKKQGIFFKHTHNNLIQKINKQQ